MIITSEPESWDAEITHTVLGARSHLKQSSNSVSFSQPAGTMYIILSSFQIQASGPKLTTLNAGSFVVTSSRSNGRRKHAWQYWHWYH